MFLKFLIQCRLMLLHLRNLLLVALMDKNVGIELGDTVVVIGAGPIGLMHIILAKLSGASNVIVSELSEKRREAALAIGADHAIDSSKQNLKDFVMSETDGVGADVVIMAIGIPSLVNSAFELLRKEGAPICLLVSRKMICPVLM